MKLAIMQPYFLPYIGYFQLMNLVDKFVVFDNIQYTKRGWFNRNRLLLNGNDEIFTINLKKSPPYLDVIDMYVSDNWNEDSLKLLNKIKVAYKKAPMFEEVYPLIASCINFEDKNLFNFILHSLHQIKDFLSITTPLIPSSSVLIDHSLKSDKKILAICKSLNATHYINPIGGVELYNKNDFNEVGLDLSFCKSNNIEYKQFKNEFVPSLSILDVLMFNTKSEVLSMLDMYTLE